MSIHHCPRCELRFAVAPEVRQHLVDDHRFEPEWLESHGPSVRAGVHAHRPVPQVVR